MFGFIRNQSGKAVVANRQLFTEADTPFLEGHGRLVFLSYRQPIINGADFYRIESQFTDLRRMDIVVDYSNQQFIIEL